MNHMYLRSLYLEAREFLIKNGWRIGEHVTQNFERVSKRASLTLIARFPVAAFF